VEKFGISEGPEMSCRGIEATPKEPKAPLASTHGFKIYGNNKTFQSLRSLRKRFHLWNQAHESGGGSITIIARVLCLSILRYKGNNLISADPIYSRHIHRGNGGSERGRASPRLLRPAGLRRRWSR
jgi:hypothetical protein